MESIRLGYAPLPKREQWWRGDGWRLIEGEHHHAIQDISMEAPVLQAQQDANLQFVNEHSYGIELRRFVFISHDDGNVKVLKVALRF